MSLLKPRWLCAVGVLGLVLASALSLLLDTPEALSLPVISQVLSLTFAAVTLLLARRVREHVKDPRGRPIEPIFAARVAVLAQTAAVYGSLITGWGLGILAHELPLVAYRGLTAGLLLALANGAVGLAVALCGVIAERWCRRPPDDPETGGGSRGWGRIDPKPTEGESGYARGASRPEPVRIRS